MASLMEELLSTMDGETEQYEKLISLNDKKKDSIIHQKLDVLENVTIEEQSIADSLLELEHKRLHILQSMAGVMGHDGEEITVSWMIDNLSSQPKEQSQLQEAKDKLVKAADQVKIGNFQIQNLLKQAIEMVEFDMNLIKSSKQAPQTSNYGKNAVTTGSLLGRSGFDAKQ